MPISSNLHQEPQLQQQCHDFASIHSPSRTETKGTPRRKDLSELYALRYRVYCLQRGILCPSKYPSGLESDLDDQRSAHFAARDHGNELVGTARLILGNAKQPFPLEKYCSTFEDFVPPPPGLAAEVSRLAVCKNSLQSSHDSQYSKHPLRSGRSNAETRTGPRQLRNAPPPTVLHLYRQMYRYSREHGIHHWYAAMERPLIRILARMGVVFTKIGPEQDYYGPVVPCTIVLDTLERQLEADNPALINWFRLDS